MMKYIAIRELGVVWTGNFWSDSDIEAKPYDNTVEAKGEAAELGWTLQGIDPQVIDEDELREMFHSLKLAGNRIFPDWKVAT